ncbi:MAG: rod-binding protein, partial [Deltaproteobacteria bacterium]|nr:rod-binding protein [Deltaproteobacteria bacterium]
MDSQKSLQLAKMKNSSQEARDYAFKMEAVKKNLMPPVDKAKKLRESCEGFESIFIQKMWEQMRATIPESGLLKGREEKFWQSVYDQELA